MRDSRPLSRSVLGRLGWASLLVLIAAAGKSPADASAAGANGAVIWSIGKADGSPIELAPGSPKSLTYTVGQSVPSRDFAGHQSGSVGFDPAASGERPYSIDFDLPRPAQGPYHLVLDLIYRAGAPRQIRVDVNGKRGIFPVCPLPKEDIDSNDGNLMLLAGQRLSVAVDPSWLKPKGNRITIFPLGLGDWDYDAMCFAAGESPGATWPAEPRLEPTVFFTNDDGRLVEACRLLVPFRERFAKGAATIRLGDQTIDAAIDPAGYDFGVLAQEVKVPALDEPAVARLDVTLDGRRMTATHDFVPAKRWKLYVCPKVHNDVGYTALQPHVNELDTRNTDTVLSILSKYPFYKFNFETSWLIDNYLDCRPEANRNEFFQRAAEKRAAVNAFYLNLMTGICTGEELYRAMYFTHRLHREHDSNFDYACLTDAPSHTWFLPTLLTDVGIKAFANGSNQNRAPILVHSDLNEDSPFKWEGLNGERILMWYARAYRQWKMLTAPMSTIEGTSYEYLKGSVPQYLARYARDGYAPDAVMVYGAYVDNAEVPQTGGAELIEKWRQEYAYPELLVASDAEYFDYIEKNFAARLPVYRGDAGAYWEDGVASSAEATVWNRHSQQILPVAETISSFATLFEPRYRYPAEDFRGVWKNVLFYDEHTWGAHTSITQPDREFVTGQWEIKESYARRANLDARNLLARSLNRLCQQMAVEGNTVFAFNCQNRVRSEPLEVEIDQGTCLVDPATQKPVPLDVIFTKDGYQRVRFMAQDVPPLGYRGYRVVGAQPPSEKIGETRATSGWTIDGRHYRLTLDRKTGGIKSLYDKQQKRELADARAPLALNEYLYVSGGQDSLILDDKFGSAPAELVIHRPSAAEVVENVQTPLGQRIVVKAQAKNTPTIRSEYRLYDHLKRLDIVNTVEKEEIRDKEAVYFAFPFAAEKPALEYQIQNGWVRPNEDQLPGACREWFTPQNVVHVRDGQFSVAWSTPDAPLVTFVDINRGKWLSHLDVTNGHVYSYVMNNYWFTNYRAAQGGRLTFRYSITSGSQLHHEQLAAFDADTRTPVFAYPFMSTFSARISQRDRRLDPGSGSLLELDAPNLQMVVLKAAEDGDGSILRFLETAGRSGQVELKSPILPIQEAYLSNGVEVNQRPLAATPQSVTIPYEPNRFTTVRLRMGTSSESVNPGPLHNKS